MGPIQQFLDISLDEVHEWLRVDPDLETVLVQPSEAGAVTHMVSELTGLRSGRWVTLNGKNARISYVDLAENLVVLDRVVSVGVLPEGTSLVWYHQNNTLMNALETAKARADQYLGNPFTVLRTMNGATYQTVEIPPEVKTWVLSYIAFQYEKPELGLVADSVRESGSRRFDTSVDVIMEPVQHLRRYPL